MRKNNIDYIIETNNSEEKKALYEELQSRLNISESCTQPTRRKFSIQRLVVFSVLFVVICLAVVLPLTLREGDINRYMRTADCERIEIDSVLKEYAAQNNLAILYIDWYDISEDTNTALYVDAENADDVVMMEESYVNGETCDIVTLFIVDINTYVDTMDFYYESCIYEFQVSNVNIHWCSTDSETFVYFEYQGYRYYIELDEPNRENLVKELVAGMLS